MTDQPQPPLQIAVVPVTPFQQNCAIVWEPKSNEAAIVDPGGDVDCQRLAAVDTALAMA